MEPHAEGNLDRVTSEIILTLDLIKGRNASFQEALVARKVAEWQAAGILHDILLSIDRKLTRYNSDMDAHIAKEDMSDPHERQYKGNEELLGQEASEERNNLSRLKFLILLKSARDNGNM